MSKFLLKENIDTDTVLGQYIKDRDFISIIRGPLGSGKTYGSCQRIVHTISEQSPNKSGIRRSRWVAIRNTYSELFSTTIKDFLDLFEDLGIFRKGSGVQPPAMHLKFQLKDKSIVEAELAFIALDRPQAIKKLRGQNLTGVWLNEVAELDKSVLDMASFRVGRFPSKAEGGPSWHGILGDTNSYDEDHWLYQIAEVEKPKDWHFHVQPGGLIWDHATETWSPNPLAENLHNLPDDYYVKGAQGKAHSWIKTQLANEYGSVEDGKAVYKEQWRESLHLNENIIYNPEEEILVGMDFGLTPSAVIAQPTQRGGLNILDEIVTFDMGIRQFATNFLLPLLQKKYRDAPAVTFVGDPAGAQRSQADEKTVFAELDDLGIYCEPASTNKTSIRLEAVRFFLEQIRDGRAALQLHPRCDYIRRAMNGGYKYRRLQIVGTERYADIPEKNKFSHVSDAVQYLCLLMKDSLGYSDAVKEKLNQVIQSQIERRMVG
jgi:hypothetical protein